MSEVKVLIEKIFIKPHPNADKLELGNIGHPEGWQVVVQKDQFKTGDLVAYIPENSVVPEWLLKKYNFWNESQNKGILAGPKGDRIKAIKLRGEFSLGIVIPTVKNGMGDFVFLETDYNNCLGHYVLEGTDVTEYLEITKYEPVIPVHLSGEVFYGSDAISIKYDIENIKNYPELIKEGDPVQISEKIHGTHIQIIYVPENNPLVHPEMLKVSTTDGKVGYFAVASKGLAEKGLFFKWNENNQQNIYLINARPYLENILNYVYQFDSTIVFCGEVFGFGIQDLHYGRKQNETSFRLFDIYIGTRNAGRFVEDQELNMWCERTLLDRVPIMYRGPYNKEFVEGLYQNKKSCYADQIIEGVVIKPVPERNDPAIGRVALKAINEAYLLRKNATEFN